jgi:hypothetical protein
MDFKDWRALMKMRLIIVASLAGLVLVASTQMLFAWGAIAVDDEPGLDPDSVGYGIISGYAIETRLSMMRSMRAKMREMKIAE